MLKNLKVGTKLVAILVAPVLVLLLLAVVGVNQRMNEASDAERVSQLTEFTEASSLLVKELQLEGLYSAVYASTDTARGKPELDAQRLKTDEALKGYTESLESVQPGRDDEAVASR